MIATVRAPVAPDAKGHARLPPDTNPDPSLLALDAISSILAPHLFRVWDDRDKDKVIAFLGAIVPQLLPLVRPRSVRRLPHAVKTLSTLVALAEYTDIAKTWRKLLWELFLSPDFFQTDPHALRLWAVLVDSLLMRPHEGPQALHELVNTKVITDCWVEASGF